MGKNRIFAWWRWSNDPNRIATAPSLYPSTFCESRFIIYLFRFISVTIYLLYEENRTFREPARDTLQRVSKSFRSIIVSKTSASFAMSVSNCFRSIPVCVCGSFETEDIGSFADLINFASMLYIFMCSSMNCDTRYCFRSGFSLESFSD